MVSIDEEQEAAKAAKAAIDANPNGSTQRSNEENSTRSCLRCVINDNFFKPRRSH